jgi:hypothetical protein
MLVLMGRRRAGLRTRGCAAREHNRRGAYQARGESPKIHGRLPLFLFVAADPHVRVQAYLKVRLYVPFGKKSL